MDPKIKQETDDLVNIFWLTSLKMTKPQAVMCALICVNKIMDCEINKEDWIRYSDIRFTLENM